jgi:hypothetical protein
VFWNRAAREMRRQNVVDDLVELNPGERRSRIDRAVAEGDIRADEVEQALRLVGRLDGLRSMTIPGTRASAPPAGAKADEALEALESLELASVKPAPRLAMKRRRRRVAISVAPDPSEPSALPGVTTQSRRSITRDVAIRKASRAVGGSPGRRRLRLLASVAARTHATTATTASSGEAGSSDVSAGTTAAAEARPEEQRPSISWLRP